MADYRPNLIGFPLPTPHKNDTNTTDPDPQPSPPPADSTDDEEHSNILKRQADSFIKAKFMGDDFPEMKIDAVYAQGPYYEGTEGVLGVAFSAFDCMYLYLIVFKLLTVIIQFLSRDI
jgi:hypothetical protein